MAAEALTCFAAGTRIATLSGAVAVENLRATQVVRAAFEGLGSVTWVGRLEADCNTHPDLAPVRIRAGAFGKDMPERDLRLSRDHAVFVADPSGASEGVLIPVFHLLNGGSIAVEPVDRVTYYHVELGVHDVLIANGLTVESGHGVGDPASYECLSTIAPRAHDPDLAAPTDETEACAPVLQGGPWLDAVRARLAEIIPTPAPPLPEPEIAPEPGMAPEPETAPESEAAPEPETAPEAQIAAEPEVAASELEAPSRPAAKADFSPPDSKAPPAVVTESGKPTVPATGSNARPRRLDRYLAVYSESEYLARNPDVARAVGGDQFACGLVHYLTNGFHERRAMCAFDGAAYKAHNPAALAAVQSDGYEDLLHHYVEVGRKQGFALN